MKNNKKAKQNTGKDSDIFFNASHCADPTAYEAIKKVDAELDVSEESWRFHELLDAIHNICALGDFELQGRITVKDKRTGKIWR